MKDVNDLDAVNNANDVSAMPLVGERNDLWWINDEYITLGLYMIAQQFICEESVIYVNVDAFVERATYIMRQHCPILYSFFFTQAGVETLPFGTQTIIVNTIREKRPLFMMGMMLGDSSTDG